MTTSKNTFELYEHQKIALSFLRTNDNFALFMDPGTGKTLPTLVHVLELLKSGEADNALIVAPKSALGAWVRDMEKFPKDDVEKLSRCATLINYDRVWRGSFQERQFDIIVLDEAHCIKNRTSNRSKALLKMSCEARYRYILTGTPISNGQLENIWSLYCFLDPYKKRGRVYSDIFRRHLMEHAAGSYRGSYYEFQDRYCLLDRYHKPAGYVNVRELQDLIAEHCYRVTKEECLDLPEKLPDEIVSVSMTEKVRYKKMMKESALLEFEMLAENPLTRMLRLRQMCSGFLQDESGTIELKCEKPQILQELIEGYPEEKKLVIFAEFKHSIKAISALLEKMKVRYLVLDGGQKDKMIWRRFQHDADIRVIVCQYQTANAGIDLYASDTIIYYEPTIRSTVLEQSRDRIHRRGQKQVCSYIHLLTAGTIEEDIYKTVAAYSDFSEKLFTEYMDRYRRSYAK